MKKAKKVIQSFSYGGKELDNYFNKDIPIPYSCRYKITIINANFCFMGNFEFGTKEELMQVASIFGVPVVKSFNEKVGCLVVDNLNRTDSISIDKARRRGILIISEEEFFNLISSNKKKARISYE